VHRVSDEETGADRADALETSATETNGTEAHETDDTDHADAIDQTWYGDLELGPAADPVAVARRRHGAAGAMLAAGLFGIDVALGRKPREDIPVVVASNSEPMDIDSEGIEIAVDEHTTVVAPALARSEPASRPRRARRSRRAR
jgi:hypothetical protein